MSTSYNTSIQFDQVISTCKDIFQKKLADYGTAWRIMRPASITDQIFIKAQRIRTIQIKGKNLVDEDITPEFIGIVNYAVIGLIQLRKGIAESPEMQAVEAIELYDEYLSEAKDLMNKKNHDYDEAWRVMRVSSITDLILMKVLRVKQIEENMGQTIVSEGIPANYLDMINYAMFALIKLQFQENSNL